MPLQRETLCRYHYDALDQLIGHAQPDTPERQRFYCKSRLATEIHGAIRLSILQQGDQLLAQQQRQADALDTTLLATDQQRSVLHSLGEPHQRQPSAYSPYGHRPAESGLTSLLGFNGERPDPVTGHYLLGNGYRAFNPVLMRFNSPDSLSPFGKGGLNAYAYCLGDPVNNSDPTGHLINPFILKAMASRWLTKTRANLYTLSSKRPKLVDFIIPGETNGKWSLDVAPPNNRPVNEVKPVQTSTTPSLETPPANEMGTHQARATSNANELSRNLETRRRLEVAYANTALTATDTSPAVLSRGPVSLETLEMHFGFVSLAFANVTLPRRYITSRSVIKHLAPKPPELIRHF